MLRTLWTSKTGLNANQDKLDAISNNIANSTTVGYKKINVGFKNLLSESLDRQGYPINDKNAIMGTGVKTTNWYQSGTQGNLTSTGVLTDLCIEGENSYFRLTTPNGESVYSRDGSFQIDPLGRIVDTNGNILEVQYLNGRNENNTYFSPEAIKINDAGDIYLKEGGNYNLVGKINTYTAIGSEAFIPLGNNVYAAAEDSNIEVSTTALIHQGYLEASNVDVAQEFTDMIVTQRAFQLSSKALQTADEMWGMINNIR